jgi:hypothetical protein
MLALRILCMPMKYLLNAEKGAFPVTLLFEKT